MIKILFAGLVCALLSGCVSTEDASQNLAESGLWQHLGNHENCVAWNPYPQDGETLIWTGECVNGKAEGEGELISKSDTAIESCLGRLIGGKASGYTVCETEDGPIRVVMRGTVEQDQWTGSGGIWMKESSTLFWQNGTWYDNALAGYGELHSSGKKCAGIWRGDKLDEGRCSYGLRGGSPRYDLEYKDGKPNGPNVITFPNGGRYEAGLHDEKTHETGVFTDAQGVQYKAAFIGGCLFVGDDYVGVTIDTAYCVYMKKQERGFPFPRPSSP